MRITTMLTGGLLTAALAGTAMAQPMGPRADTNQDGQVTQAEFTAMTDARFNAIDTNGNGQIEAAERQAVREARKAKWAERRAARAARTGETAAVAKAPGEMRGKMRASNRPKMDANGDGIVTREEFNAVAMARFARMDANGDGTFSQEERTAMKEARKAKWAERRAQQ